MLTEYELILTSITSDKKPVKEHQKKPCRLNLACHSELDNAYTWSIVRCLLVVALYTERIESSTECCFAPLIKTHPNLDSFYFSFFGAVTLIPNRQIWETTNKFSVDETNFQSIWTIGNVRPNCGMFPVKFTLKNEKN